MKNFFPYLFMVCASMALTACGDKPKNEDWSENRQMMETRAQELLARARSAHRRGDYTAVKALVDTIRRECNLALSAREETIQLLDSVEMGQAIHEMVRLDSLMQSDSMMVDSLQPAHDEAERRLKFYRRKLEHDRQLRTKQSPSPSLPNR